MGFAERTKEVNGECAGRKKSPCYNESHSVAAIRQDRYNKDIFTVKEYRDELLDRYKKTTSSIPWEIIASEALSKSILKK